MGGIFGGRSGSMDIWLVGVVGFVGLVSGGWVVVIEIGYGGVFGRCVYYLM